MHKQYSLIVALILSLLVGTWYVTRPVESIPTEAVATPSIATVATTTVETPTTTGVSGRTTQPTPPAANAATTGTNAPATPAETGVAFTLTVGGTSYDGHVPRGATVFDAMEKLNGADGFTFTATERPGMGYFIDSIAGKANGDGYYWFLYVNDVSSGTGASQTVVKAGDRIEWRYKKSY